MFTLKKDALIEYLYSIYKEKIELVFVNELGKEKKEVRELKAYGYGIPILLEFKVGGENKKVVLETVRPGGFGHNYMSDRAASLVLEYNTFNRLAKHVKALDLGAFTDEGDLVSIKKASEFFILVDYVSGKEYYKDLEELRGLNELALKDKEKARVLADYLAQIHSKKKKAPELYVRRIRELIGHSECIMGLIDSYAATLDDVTLQELKLIESMCNEWRWKIKDKPSRLCQVHGDFHPWNILFRDGTDFVLLDRSRGEFGEAADDLSALAINYLFYSLQEYGELAGPFKELWDIFFDAYLQETNDREILKVIPPFFAWRGLVVANPIWYPELSIEVRRKIFNFIQRVLQEEVFDFRKVDSYLH